MSKMKEEEPTKKYSVKYKRNRSSRACEVCHSRKVRCDATIHIPCTNCLTFGCECRFPEPKERKNARQKKSSNGIDSPSSSSVPPNSGGDSSILSVNSLIDNDSNDSQNNGSTPSSVPNHKQNQEKQKQQDVQHQQQQQQQEQQHPPVSTSSNKRRNEPLAAISARSASIDNQKLTKQHFSTLSFHGRASTAVLLAVDKDTDTHVQLQDYVPPALKNSIDQTRVGLDTVQMEILRLRGAFLLPEKSLCDDLIKTFFEHIYPVEPIVDRAMLMKQYENGTASLLLLQSIFLAASRVSDNELIFDSNGSNYLTSATFYQRAKALYEANYEKDPIPIVQSLILFSRFWEGIDDILGNSFYWTRIAITAAQGFGFHRNMLKTGGNFSPEEVRVSSILWWNLYIRDISCAVAFGRPRVIHLEDCDVPMLTPDDFTNDLAPHDAEAFIHMIRLSEIMSIVLQEQYSVRAEKTKRHREKLVMTHCDMIMSNWRSNLPPQLQYQPHQHLPLSVNIMNLYYYSAVCLVHRSSMVRTVDGKQYPSEGIVFKASRIIADIASKLLKSNDIRYCHALTIPVFFTASLTFICHMDSNNASIAKSAKLCYDVCYRALKEIGKNYLVAVLIQHGLKRFADDSKLRERLVNGMIRKSADSGNQTNGAPTPMFTSTAGTPVPFTPNFAASGAQGFVDFNTPGVSQAPTPIIPSAGTANTPMIPLQQPPPTRPHSQPHPQSLRQPQPSSDSQSQSQPAQPEAQQQHSFSNTPTPQQESSAPPIPEQTSLEFPDLYLFTNTLPPNGPTDFDPSELFPTHQPRAETTSTKSDVTSDGLPTDFNLNLPEFDFQNFANTISFTNLASMNTFLGDQSHEGSPKW